MSSAGQNLTTIRALLREAGLVPQRRFGQNFLIDLNLMRKLVQAGEVGPGDTVLEIGPGAGSLTEMLLERGASVVAVEIDRGLCRILHERLGANGSLTLLQADALASKHEINPMAMRLLDERAAAGNGVRRLVANLPYQIATPTLMNALLDGRIAHVACTIQKEVGERLWAHPRSEAYGPVSVLAQSFATPHLVAILPPTVFWPAPRVESVMLTLRPRPREAVDIDDPPAFAALVHDAFAQRRKTLRRIARRWGEPAAKIFDRAGVSPERRPEELAPAQWRALYRAARRSGAL